MYSPLSRCSTKRKPTLLQSRQYVVNGKPYNVPKGIKSEEKLFRRIMRDQERDLHELSRAYHSKWVPLESESRRVVKSMGQSWWYFMGCKGPESQRLDVLESEMRIETTRYQEDRGNLERFHDAFLRAL